MGLLLLMGGVSDPNPQSLFSNNELGLAIDIGDRNGASQAKIDSGLTGETFKAAYPNHSLYVDSNGVAPAVYPGDQVGLVIDSSRGGLENLGAELVTNGDFSNGTTGWTAGANSTVSVEASFQGRTNVYKITNNSTSSVTTTQTVSGLVAGKWYRLSCYLYAPSSNTAANAAAIFPTELFSSGRGAATVEDSWVLVTRTFQAASTTTSLAISATASGSATSGDVAYFDDISIKEIPGIHPYQTTSGSRPALCRTPDGGRRNLLTYTEEFDNSTSAGWTKLNTTVTANSSTPPYSSQQVADRVVETTATGEHRVENTTAFVSTSGAVFTISVYAKAAERSRIRLGFSDIGNIPGRAFFDLSNGTFDNAIAGTTAAISDEGNGWYRCSVTATCATGGNQKAEVNLVSAGTTISYTGNTANGVLLSGIQAERSSTATTYQRVTTTHDVTESGKRDCWGLLADGSDDSLITTSVDFNTWTAQTRRNVLIEPEAIDVAAWTKSNATITSGVADPLGGTTAQTLTASGASGLFYQVFSGLSGSVTNSVWIRRRTGTGVVRFYTGNAAATQQMQSVITSDWQRLSTATATAGGTVDRFGVICETIGDAVDIWHPQFELGSVATDYQRVGTDKMTVMAGVRKNSDSADAMVCELTTSYPVNAGSFYLCAPEASGSLSYSSAARGTTASNASFRAGFAAATGAAPDLAILSTTHDLSGDLTTLRRNGVAASNATGDKGSGNFTSSVIYIFRRGGSTLYFPGILYTLIIRGAATPTGTIADFEKNLLRIRAGLGPF